jgi:DNA-binding beta-propeller fold protein YncE
VDKPARQIRGDRTQLADPRGLSWDEKHHEIVVATLGNWSRAAWDADFSGGGQYRPPSILVFAETADRDAKPLRVIQGDQTALNLPSGLAVDPEHDEIMVANSGTGSVTVYGRTVKGNVAPIRTLQGPHTMLKHPIGLALDLKHNELWVANWGHTAEVFDRTASGDATPKRVIRSAPPGTGVAGLSVIPAIGFDTKRDQLLIPN